MYNRKVEENKGLFCRWVSISGSPDYADVLTEADAWRKFQLAAFQLPYSLWFRAILAVPTTMSIYSNTFSLTNIYNESQYLLSSSVYSYI